MSEFNKILRGSKRDATLDIVKGICIFLMVIGHSGAPGYFVDFIYMFHMPCFFFISGMLLSDRYLTDVKKGILKKLKGYYLPFVKWELIFLLLHNVFAFMNIYDSTYTWREMAIKTMRIFTMSGGEQLLGGYWFLISLTWASIGTIVIFSLFYKKGKLNNLSMSVMILLMILIASVEKYLPLHIPNQFGPKTFMALAFFMSGYFWRKSKLQNGKYSPFYILLLLIPAIATLCNYLFKFNVNRYLLLQYLIAMCGTLGVISLAKHLNYDKIRQLFNYIGNKTLYILTFHFLSFKAVSYLYLKINALPLQRLSAFPTLNDTNAFMWIIYTIVGVTLPLLIWEMVDRIEKQINTKKAILQKK